MAFQGCVSTTSDTIVYTKKNEGKSRENNRVVSSGQWILRFLPLSAFKEARGRLKSHRQEAEGNTAGDNDTFLTAD